MSAAANRYAKALLDLAVSDNAIDGYQKELAAVLQSIGAETGLSAFLRSPRNSPAVKKNVLIYIFEGLVRKNILHLLLLLLDKGRIDLLPDIGSAFAQMADGYRNILNIAVVSALPIDQAQTDKIAEKFKALYQGASVRITAETDASLIGGIKVIVGDKLYDGTVKGKLSGMKSAVSGK